MTVPVVAFFNNKGGVGKTSLVYHLSWMFAELSVRVVASDLDPQCNLTAAFLDEDRLEDILGDDDHSNTIFGAVEPLKAGSGDVRPAHLEGITDDLGLVLGDMALSRFEDDLSEQWPKTLGGEPRAFRVMSAFWRCIQQAGSAFDADIILVDLGPNLGAINRAALIGADYVIIPLGPDLFSILGMRNLGPVLHEWRTGWKKRLKENTSSGIDLPDGTIRPLGYVILRHTIRLDRPVKAYDRWIQRIPGTYAKSVLQEEPRRDLSVGNDEHCLAWLKDYRSLMPMAQEARKPMFHLRPADGALGSHTYAVANAYDDFKNLVIEIASRVGVSVEGQ